MTRAETMTVEERGPVVMGRGTRVWWHGLFGRPEFTGTVLDPARANDLRALVRWDRDQGGEGQWTSLSTLRRVGKACPEPCCKTP